MTEIKVSDEMHENGGNDDDKVNDNKAAEICYIDWLHEVGSFIVSESEKIELLDEMLDQVECTSSDREEIMYYVSQLTPTNFNDVEAYIDSIKREYEQAERTTYKTKKINHFRRKVMMSV